MDNHGNSKCALFRVYKQSYILFYENDFNKTRNIKLQDENIDYVDTAIARFPDFDLCGFNAKYFINSNIQNGR